MTSKAARPPFALQVGLLAIAAAALYCIRLGAAPVERAEIYFIDAARGMVESGDWLVPRYRGQPFFDKPALTYWLIALAFELGGFTLAAARVVPVVAAAGVVAVTALLGRRLFDEGTGLRAAVVQATTLLVMSFSRVAMSDMPLTFFSTLAVLLGVGIVRRPAPVDWRWALALGAVLGLGFLTKGPVALLLPGLGLLLLLHGLRWRVPFDGRGWVACVAAAVVLGLGWFVLVAARLGADPLRYFFLRENLERFAGGTYDAERSPLYYLGAYLAVALPWSLLFAPAAWRLARGERFLLGWIALMLVPLSLSRGKIDYYLLPLTPACAVVIGRWLGLAWERTDRRWARGAVALCGAAIAALPIVAAQFPAAWLPKSGWRVVLLAVCAGSLGLVARALWRPTPPAVLRALALPAAALFAVLAASYLPAFRSHQPNALIVADVQRELRYTPEASLAVCADPVRAQRDILFFARLPVVERCDLYAPAAAGQPFMLLVEPGEYASLIRTPGMREVAQYHGVPATALTLGGLLGGVSPLPVYLIANYETDDPVAVRKHRRERRRDLFEAWAMAPPETPPERKKKPSGQPGKGRRKGKR